MVKVALTPKAAVARRPRRRQQRTTTTARMMAFSARDKAFVVAMCAALTSLTATLQRWRLRWRAQLGMSPYTPSCIFLPHANGKLVTSPIAGWLASRFGRKPVLCGVAQVSASSIFTGLTPVVPGAAGRGGNLLLTFAGLCRAAVSRWRSSRFLQSGDAFPAQRGLVVGSATAMIALGWTIGPPIGGLPHNGRFPCHYGPGCGPSVLCAGVAGAVSEAK